MPSNAAKPYRRTCVTWIRPYVPGEDMTNIFVSPRTVPQPGGMVVVPENRAKEYYISETFFKQNYEPYE